MYSYVEYSKEYVQHLNINIKFGVPDIADQDH